MINEKDGDQIRDEVNDLLFERYYDLAFEDWCQKNNVTVEEVDAYLEDWDVNN